MKILLRFFGLSVFLAGITNALAQPTLGDVLWTFDTPYLIRSSPAVALDSTVYVCAGNTLYAITNYGSNSWSFTMADGDCGSPVVAADGSVLLTNGKLGNLYALESDGSLKWAFPTAGGNVCPALAFDGTAYVNGYHKLYAASTLGTTNWSLQDGGDSLFASPVLTGASFLYVAPRDLPKLWAVSTLGLLKWSIVLDDTPGDSPALGADNTAYIGAGPLYAFSADGANLWTSQTNYFRCSSPVIGKDGTIYATTSRGSLCAFTASGDFKWQVLTNGYTPGTSPAVDSAGTIYCLAYSVLYAISPAGVVQWSVPLIPDPEDMFGTSRTSPTIAPDGTIYVTSANRLYAIYGTNSLADSPWPMYRQNARHTGKIEKPALQQPKKRADANFEFQLYAQLGQTNVIETTTNLNSWTSLTSVVVTTVPQPVVDLTASNHPARFYRSTAP